MKSIVSRTLVASALALTAMTASASAADETVNYAGMRMKAGAVIPGVGQVLIPESSVPKAGGLRAHTHLRVLSTIEPAVPPGLRPSRVAPHLFVAETPASLACVYGLAINTLGCNPSKVVKVAKGGSRAIAIVDAFHNKTANKDLKKFSTQFHLPAPRLTVIYCSATSCARVKTAPRACRPTRPNECGWALESALDIQWAHAMAPSARLFLVEAHSDSFVDLMRAEDRAAQLVAQHGGGQVSNSWGGSDIFNHTADDHHFVKSKVVFFASTGDHKGGTNVPDVEWPSTSPNVIAVGGTSIVRTKTGAFHHEAAWLDTGGGLSNNYPRPSFQSSIATRVGNHRGVPDIAWDADPQSGGFVFCSAGTCGSSGGFFVVGGTSLAAPAIAGMTNNAGHFRANGNQEHAALYAGLGGARFHDIVKGKCGNKPNGAFTLAVRGWDRCTGIGTPKGKTGL